MKGLLAALSRLSIEQREFRLFDSSVIRHCPRVYSTEPGEPAYSRLDENNAVYFPLTSVFDGITHIKVELRGEESSATLGRREPGGWKPVLLVKTSLMEKGSCNPMSMLCLAFSVQQGASLLKRCGFQVRGLADNGMFCAEHVPSGCKMRLRSDGTPDQLLDEAESIWPLSSGNSIIWTPCILPSPTFNSMQRVYVSAIEAGLERVKEPIVSGVV